MPPSSCLPYVVTKSHARPKRGSRIRRGAVVRPRPRLELVYALCPDARLRQRLNVLSGMRPAVNTFYHAGTMLLVFSVVTRQAVSSYVGFRLSEKCGVKVVCICACVRVCRSSIIDYGFDGPMNMAIGVGEGVRTAVVCVPRGISRANRASKEKRVHHCLYSNPIDHVINSLHPCNSCSYMLSPSFTVCYLPG